MLLRLVQHVPAVYFSMANESSPHNEDLCAYLLADFSLWKGVESPDAVVRGDSFSIIS